MSTFVNEGEEPVGHVVPEVEDAVGAAVKSVAEHHVRLALEDGLEQDRVVARVVLEVGVLDDDDVPARLGQTRADRRALAAVDGVPDEAEALGARRTSFSTMAAVSSFEASSTTMISRARSSGRGVDPRDDLRDGVLLVVGGHDDRDECSSHGSDGTTEPPGCPGYASRQARGAWSMRPERTSSSRRDICSAVRRQLKPPTHLRPRSRSSSRKSASASTRYIASDRSMAS